MDVNRFLDIEKRTGIKNAELDEFLEKAKRKKSDRSKSKCRN